MGIYNPRSYKEACALVSLTAKIFSDLYLICISCYFLGLGTLKYRLVGTQIVDTRSLDAWQKEREREREELQFQLNDSHKFF